MTKEIGNQSPAAAGNDSNNEDNCKSKRGRKPSQAKLAMLESKKLFSDAKKKSDDSESNGSVKKQLKKKKLDLNSKMKKNFETQATPPKKRKLNKEKGDLHKSLKHSKKSLVKQESNLEEEPRKRVRKHPLRYRDGEVSDDISSEDELWGEQDEHDQDDMFFDSDNDDFDQEFLQNSDEDTEDASETDMATLEEEISVMKERMCQEKMKDVKKKIDQLNQKTLPEYVSKIEELKRQRDDWIRMAYAFKAYEEREIERDYELEKRLAKHDLEVKRNELKELLVSELYEKKRLIESEKSALELTGSVCSLLPMDVKPVVTRKLRRRPNDPPPVTEKKRKTPTAQLNFLLMEDQIMSDLKKLNKHCKSPQDDKSNIPKTTEKCDPSEFPDGSDAKTKDEKLYYNKEWYQAGDPIYLNSRDGERFNAQIHSVTNAKEIWIKKLNEGTRLKIYVGHLQRGKYSIERREIPTKK